MKFLPTLSIFFAFFLIFPFNATGQRYWVSATPANWSGDNWSSTSGGAPDGGGPPTAGTDAIFDGNGVGDCTVDVAANFDGINTTNYTGIIDLNGSVFSISGVNNCIFSDGTINDTPGTSLLQINTSGVVRFSGTIFGAEIDATGAIDFDAGTFNNNVSVTHGFSNQYGNGGCTFNGSLSISNGSGNEIRLGVNNPDTYNGTVTIDNSGSSWVRMAYNSPGNAFNNDISVSSSGSASGISFSGGGSGTSTFGAGVNFTIGSDFTSGDLILESITQTDATNFTLDLNGTARIYLYNSIFLGDLDIQSPRVYLRENTFNGLVDIVKEGASNDASHGGNVFNDVTHLHLTGSGYLLMGNSLPDIWNADLTLTNEGTDILYVAHNTPGNEFNGDVIFECTSSNGIRIGQGGTSTSTLSAGNSLTVGPLGFSDGLLILYHITQVGGTAQSLDLSGNGRIAIDDCTFDGDLTFSSPRLQFANSTFNGSVDFTKEGTTTDVNDGGNTFNNPASFTHMGSNDWRFATSNPDIYNNTVSYYTSGDASARILPSFGSLNNQFNDDVTLQNTNSGGVYIGPGNGTSTLAAGKTIQIGGAGFNDGILYLYNITQADATTINLIVTDATITRITNNTFLGNVSVISPRIYVEDNSFSGNLSVNKTGGNNDDSGGGNTINGSATITNSGSGRILFGNSNPDIFNGDLFVNNIGSDIIYLAHNSAGNEFNGNVELVNTTGNSIRISQGGSSSSTLATGQTITIGAGGFANGDLYIDNFTQSGNTAQNLTLDNSARLYLDGTTWEGDFTGTSGYLETDYSTFEGTANLTQNGSLANSSCSGNDFQAITTITNSGDNNLYFGVTDPTSFQSDVIVNNSGTSTVRLAYQSVGNTFDGDVTLNNSGNGQGVYLGTNGTTTTFTVSGDLTLNESSAGNTNNGIANNGVGVVNGDLTINQNSTATSCYSYLANGTSSQLTVDGTVTLNNNGAATSNQEIRAGWNGSVIFNQPVIANNNSAATNSYIRFAYTSNASATFNDDIEVTTTVANSDGITFGEAGGSATLVATKTVTTGIGGFIDGNLIFRNFTQVGGTPQSLTLTGGANLYCEDSDWGGDINFVAPRLRTDGTIYRGTAYLEKTGASNDNSAGGNYFHSTLDLVHSGADNFLFGNGDADTVSNNLTVSNTGTGNFYFAYNVSDSYIDGDLNIANGATAGNLSFANTGTTSTTITGNVSITNNSSNANSAYFPNDGNISINGDLTITDNGSSGNQNFYIGDNAASVINIDGNVDIALNTSGTTGRFYFGNNATITVNGDVSFSNSSTCNNSQFYITNGGAASTNFNGNLTLENYGVGSDGFYFGPSDSPTTLAATKVVSIGGNGFTTGDLQFRNFTQIGATAQNLTLTGDAYFYNINSDWGGDVSFIGPRFRTDNTSYGGTAYLEKSGGVADDQSQGNNSFAGDFTMVNSGSRYFMMGANNPDMFSGNVTMNNTGSDDMFLAYSSAGNTIAGDLYVNHVGAGQNLNVSNSNGSTLTINGNTVIDFSSSDDNTRLYFPNDGTIDLAGDLTVVQGTSGNSSNSYFSNNSNGSLVINGTTDITNNSSSATTGRVYLGNNGHITLNGPLNIYNNATSNNAECYVNSSSGSTGVFNGDITLESVAASDGVRFGASGGSSSLSDTYTITVGAGGFDGSYLELRNFTQVGSTAQNIVTTGASTQLDIRDAIFNADASFESARIFLRENTFEGSTQFTKTGAFTDASVGGNTYNGNVTFDNASTGTFRLSSNNGFSDDYNGDVTFTESNTGDLRPTRNNSDTFAGDINLNSNDQIYFGEAGNGRVVLDGSSDQNITDLVGGVLHRMRDLEVSKPGGDVYLGSSFDILNDLALNQGIVYSDATNLIVMTDNSNVTAVSNSSHVDGPIDKIGNDAFAFPVGDNGFYRPISISNPSSGSAQFRAQYFDTDPDLSGYADNSMEATLDYISDCEYWTLDRLASGNNVSVSLSYENYSGACSGVNDPATVSVARWDGSMWRDHGNDGSATPNQIISNGAVTSFSPFTLGTNNYPTNPLPVELLSFEAKPFGDEVKINWETASEINNDYFTLERSSDGLEFYTIETIEGAGNSSTPLNYSTVDRSPIQGTSYYRLKQTDFNGEFTYSNTEVVEFNNPINTGVLLYPNPIAIGDDQLTLEFSNQAERSIIVLNQLGQVIGEPIKSTEKKLEIATSHLAKGIYFVKIVKAGTHIHVERFTVK